MRGYKIIQEEGKWLFRLFPNNSNRLEVGSSKLFDSYNECVDGVQQFRKLVIENHINSIDSPFITVLEFRDDGLRNALLEYLVDGEMIFQSRKYSSSSPITLCKKCAKSIYEHINDYTLKQVF